jgi:hypothetical protein
MDMLARHNEMRKGKGPLIVRPSVYEAIAELQQRLAKVDTTFKPKYDLRSATPGR